MECVCVEILIMCFSSPVNMYPDSLRFDIMKTWANVWLAPITRIRNVYLANDLTHLVIRVWANGSPTNMKYWSEVYNAIKSRFVVDQFKM